MASDLSNVKPRDLLQWQFNCANVARANKIKNPSRENQLIYRDRLLELHEAVAGYLGQPLEKG